MKKADISGTQEERGGEGEKRMDWEVTFTSPQVEGVSLDRLLEALTQLPKELRERMKIVLSCMKVSGATLEEEAQWRDVFARAGIAANGRAESRDDTRVTTGTLF